MVSRITTAIIAAHSVCRTKAFLIRKNEVNRLPHPLEQVLQQRAEESRARFVQSVRASSTPSGWIGLEDGGVSLSHEHLESECDAIQEIAKKGPGRYAPLMIIGTQSVDKSHKLQLAFAGYILGKSTGTHPSHGFIVNKSGIRKRVSLNNYYGAIQELLNELNETGTNEEPTLELNEHCSVCQFQQRCRQRAEDEDNLSLLSRMNRKLIDKYKDKGISTVTQLSYLYRARRRRKRSIVSKPNFNIELQALAVRTGKTYLHETPTLPSGPVEIFVDIEGIPDERFQYLIGILIRCNDGLIKQSFWADAKEDESTVFQDSLDALNQHSDAPIFHYGNYELKAFREAGKKYGLNIGSIEPRLINVNSAIFGRLYFPSRSNGLKELGKALGATWPRECTSGLGSLACRYEWEDTGDERLRSLLTEYNQSDNHALLLLTDEVRLIAKDASSRSDIDFSVSPKKSTTEAGHNIHARLEKIVRSAHDRYEQRKIRIKHRETVVKRRGQQQSAETTGLRKSRKIPRRANKVLTVPRKRKCPRHPTRPLISSDETAEHSLIDLAFSSNGCRKTVVKYVGKRGYCRLCDHGYLPPKIKQLQGRVFGHRFQSWAVYQRIVLRLSYGQISTSIEDLFNEKVSKSTIMGFVQQLSDDYLSTERAILRDILKSRVIHSDETKINIRGTNQYVWLVTDGRQAIFRHHPTRDAAIVTSLLDGFRGVLVTDFFGGYDSVCELQQKCLVHLIRDLNEDLWKYPFNVEFESFVGAVSQLLADLFADVDRYGLKTRHLRKHIRAVERFYDDLIIGRKPKCAVTARYCKRFTRYRDSIFRFLTEDEIPWHNNLAERLLRHFAIQRRISGSFGTKGAAEYFRLLSIGQTCRLQGKSFLRFLISGERDVSSFNDRRG